MVKKVLSTKKNAYPKKNWKPENKWLPKDKKYPKKHFAQTKTHKKVRTGNNNNFNSSFLTVLQQDTLTPKKFGGKTLTE